MFEIFFAFLKLGCTSFGGPVAHLGYFRNEFVEKRQWVSEGQFAQLLSVCQFLPGPASSQLGFSLGLLRGGFGGAVAAFIGFTLPSAAALVAFAGALDFLEGDSGARLIHGLKLVAVTIVAHSVYGMFRKLCSTPSRVGIAVVSNCLMLAVTEVWMQSFVIVFGAVLGLRLCRDAVVVRSEQFTFTYGTKLASLLLIVFIVLLLLPWTGVLAESRGAIFNSFYRAGALVFGGGHVVLPLLERSIVETGLISLPDFLAGYGATQAVPGPLFSFAAYLGALIPGEHGGISGAIIALFAIFLPGFLVVGGVLPFWGRLSQYPATARLVAGANAAVVGLLAATLIHPVATSAIVGPSDILICAVGLLLLGGASVSPMLIVVWCVAASFGSAWML